MVTVWLTSKKNPKFWNVFDNGGRVLSETVYKKFINECTCFKPVAFKLFFNECTRRCFCPQPELLLKAQSSASWRGKITTRTGYDVFFFIYIKLETVSTLNRWIYLTERRSSYLVPRVPFCAYSGGRVGGDPEKGVQRAKKVVSDSPGLVDFAIGLVNSVFNLPDGQVMFFEQFE